MLNSFDLDQRDGFQIDPKPYSYADIEDGKHRIQSDGDRDQFDKLSDDHNQIEIRKISGRGITRRQAELHAKYIANKLFGRDATLQNIARATGAEPGDSVRMDVWKNGMRVSVAGTGYFSTVVFNATDRTPELEELYVTHKGNGLGTAVFGRIVDGMRGLDGMKIDAIRSDTQNGFYSWARLGACSVERDPVLKNRIGYDRVEDLMATTDGPAWWKKNGWSTDLLFDLRPGSRSMNIFNAYRATKRQEA